MWILGIWILSMCKSILSADVNCSKDSYTECAPPNTFPLTIPENEIELDKSCSIVTNYMPCVRNHELACHGSFKYDEKYNKVYGTLQKMCKKDSALHKALSRNIKCIKKILNRHNETCFEERDTIRQAYFSYLDEELGKRSENLTSKDTDVFYCLEHSFDVGCFLRNVEECGTEAKEVSLDIIKISGFIVDGCPDDTKMTSILLLRYLKLGYYQEILMNEVLLMSDVKYSKKINKI